MLNEHEFSFGVSMYCGLGEAGTGRARFPDADANDVMSENMKPILIRPFADDDAEATARLYFESVRIGAKSRYDESQRRSWAPAVPETLQWLGRLRSQFTFVAVQERAVVGFMTIDDCGYIDLAYVAPDMIGKGVAGRLYETIEAHAAELAMTRLHSNASHLARAFFERQGWSVVAEQSVIRGGVALTNFAMEKHLVARGGD